MTTAEIAASWLKEAASFSTLVQPRQQMAAALVGIGHALLVVAEAVTRQDTAPAAASGPGAHNPPDR